LDSLGVVLVLSGAVKIVGFGIRAIGDNAGAAKVELELGGAGIIAAFGVLAVVAAVNFNVIVVGAVAGVVSVGSGIEIWTGRCDGGETLVGVVASFVVVGSTCRLGG
jgi:hypothetical protein